MKAGNSKKPDPTMVQSALSSITSPKMRIKYFTCNKGKDHQGEVLNYVCVKKDCSKRGLFCSMCKVDHLNHTTIPLKILLAKLQAHKQKPLESSQGFQNELAQLENIHKTMLYDLRVCVESLAQKFKEVQIQINEQFSKAKIELLERVQVNMKYNSFIDEAINNKFENRQSFIEDMAKISGMVDVDEGNTKDGKGKQLQVKFSANFELVVKTLKTLEKQMTQSFKKIQKYVCVDQKFGKYEEMKGLSEKKQKVENGKIEKIEIPSNFKFFSVDYKTPSIVLQSGNKVARQTKTGEGRFTFTNYHITGGKQKLIFKIRTLKNWIGLGVGIRQKLKYLNFRFEYNNLGHGSYLISSNGYSWSHTEQSNNIAVIQFKFKEGDLIEIEYEKTKLLFWNKATNEKHELKVAFNEAEEKDIYFCANLCSEGDSVQILDA